MPRRDQSGWRQVHCCMPKISTLWYMALTMAALEAWKAASSSGDHENWQLALRNGLKGAGRSWLPGWQGRTSS